MDDGLSRLFSWRRSVTHTDPGSKRGTALVTISVSMKSSISREERRRADRCGNHGGSARDGERLAKGIATDWDLQRKRTKRYGIETSLQGTELACHDVPWHAVPHPPTSET